MDHLMKEDGLVSRLVEPISDFPPHPASDLDERDPVGRSVGGLGPMVFVVARDPDGIARIQAPLYVVGMLATQIPQLP